MWRRALTCRVLLRPGIDPFGSPAHAVSAEACRCWSCGGALGKASPHFCPTCHALQPPKPQADFFGLLDCARGFVVDAARLRENFIALQRSLHPDHFSLRPELERGFAHQHTTQINLAYNTLRSPLHRGLYLLELNGVKLDAGSDAGAEPDFLAEVVELNEQLAATDSESCLAELERLLTAKQDELIQEVSRAFKRGDLQEARRFLGKMKYIVNLEQKVKEKKVPS